MMERRAEGLVAKQAMGDPRAFNGGDDPAIRPGRCRAPVLPARWDGILTAEEWQLAVAAIGEPRLDELRPMLAEVSPRFRASFIGHLARIAPGRAGRRRGAPRARARRPRRTGGVMTAHQLLRRRRADELLTRDYESLRREVLAGVRGQLARRGVRVDDADLDAFYNQAWQGLYDQLLAGREVRNAAGFLVVVCVRRAVDELRKAHLDRRAAQEDVGELGRDEDHAARIDDATKLRQFVEGLRDRLTLRECQAATLCYLHDYTRPEAAVLLGVEPKRMDKIMDGVSKKVGEFVRAIEAGRWCQERGSLMRAYAFGVLAEEGERRRLAGDHLASCSPCRSYVRSLRGLSARAAAGGAARGRGGRRRGRERPRPAGRAARRRGRAAPAARGGDAGARGRDGRRRGRGRGRRRGGRQRCECGRRAAQRRSWSRSWWPWRSPEAARRRWCATTAHRGTTPPSPAPCTARASSRRARLGPARRARWPSAAPWPSGRRRSARGRRSAPSPRAPTAGRRARSRSREPGRRRPRRRRRRRRRARRQRRRRSRQRRRRRRSRARPRPRRRRPPSSASRTADRPEQRFRRPARAAVDVLAAGGSGSESSNAETA